MPFSKTQHDQLLVLIPEINECCGKRVRIDPRASFPLVYTTRGTLVAAMFHSYCLTCRTRYFYGYKETGTGAATQRVYYSHISSLPYFQSTSMTMFEQALLDDVTNNIVYSAATFSSRSEVYHANHYQRNAVQLQHLSEYARIYRDQWTPTPMRIEEAWFLWRIICTYADFAQLQTSNLYTEYTLHMANVVTLNLCARTCGSKFVHAKISGWCSNVWLEAVQKGMLLWMGMRSWDAQSVPLQS